ncbi:uncharacterized protein A4U43_C01F31460 [Asparagus officinalis]|uniref:Replication protein A 70 kDa DNA-binding subunit B/D first OB fold domain-containing protein n=1 Tax=Asparagus officinalis TaxID=4686 RepID=A0A5P1FTV2_ASPOF|nr:uncharacterized protein A4U43_C01F31460 [Asparagus officinalis]
MESNDDDHHPNCLEVIYDATLVVCNTQQCTSITQSSDEDVNLMCSTSGTGYTQINCQKTPTETYARAFSVDEAKLTREVEQSFIDDDVQGNIKATEISRFRPMIEEGRIHVISKFKVITAYGDYRATQNDYFVCFVRQTEIKVLQDDDEQILRHKFKFKEYSELGQYLGRRTYLYGNNTVSSSSASRVYINIDVPKVKDLSQRNLNDSEESLQIIPTPVNFSANQPDLTRATNATLNDLLFFNDPGTSNITLEVEDYSAVSTITLFNREAEKLFKVSADEVAKNLVKIKGRKVFPSLFKGIVGKKIKVQIKDVFAPQESPVNSLTEEGPPATLTTPLIAITNSDLRNNTNIMIPKIEKVINNNSVEINKIEVEEKTGSTEQFKVPMQEGNKKRRTNRSSGKEN